MREARLISSAAPLAFAVLAGALTAIGAVSAQEATWVAVAVLVAFLPSGLAAPGGWPRRAAELCLLPAAYALTLLGDPTMRRMALPPLLVLAAWAALESALARAPERAQHRLVGAFGLALGSATGLGLTGEETWVVSLTVAAAALLPWGISRRLGPRLGTVGAFLLVAAPLQHWPAVAALAAVAGLVLGVLPGAPRNAVVGGWLPGAAAVALAASCIATWGGLPATAAFPHASWATIVTLVAAIAITPRFPAGLAGAVWFAVALAFGPLQPAPPDRAGLTLRPDNPAATLAAGNGGLYVVDLALANAGGLAQGTPVATLDFGSEHFTLLAGVDAAEWAHERDDVRATVAHELPYAPVWRPGGVGRRSLWGVAGRFAERVPVGVEPRIERISDLDARVSIAVSTAGPSRPTPPRTWSLAAWLAFAAAAVIGFQVAGGVLASSLALVPWTLLAGAALAGAMPVEPLRLLLERHAIDIALAALCAAWLSAALRWLRRRRVVLAIAALLVPLAVATPRLTPSLYGDEPFHLVVMSSLEEDQDADIRNNYDLEHYPYNFIYKTGRTLLHSPVLAGVLLPGYVAAGRTGALLLLALVGATMVALVVRRGRSLGVPESRLAMLAVLLAITYPVATFSTQIWVELPGALLLAAGLLWAGHRPPARWCVTAAALLATAMKTRLALAMFPVAVAAWWQRRLSRREKLLGLAALVVAAAAGLAVGWLFLGHPFGFYRRLHHLLPRRLSVPPTVVGGLAFDPAGGLAWTAPLALVALAGVVALWRRSGNGERASLLGLLATVGALLHSHEWYGGGSPPARYLVPFVPVFALAGAMVLREPRRWRHLALILVPPSLLSWWVLVTRPHLSVNPGDGGWWLSASLARRFAADTRHLVPTFLLPDTATIVVPIALVAVAAVAILVARRRPVVARRGAALTTAIWLLLGAAAVVVIHQRHDSVVEVEDPQIGRRGGEPVPPPGTFSRFRHPNGWRMAKGQGIEVPLNLATGSAVSVEGWIEGATFTGTTLAVRWDDGAWTDLRIPGAGPGRMEILPPPGPGHHTLYLRFEAPAGQRLVLDRILVDPK